MPSFSSFLETWKPGGLLVDDEQREAVVAGVGVGLRHEHDEVGARAVGDERLRAVDDVVVAVAHRARADSGDVRAGAGLGDAERGDLLALDRRHQVGLLQVLGAELQDRRRRHVGVDGDAHREPAVVRLRHRLATHDRHEVVAALAAVLLGEVDAEEAELAHALEDPVREAVALPLLGVGRKLLPAEALDRLAQRLVLVGEAEVLLRSAEVRLDLGCRSCHRYLRSCRMERAGATRARRDATRSPAK